MDYTLTILSSRDGRVGREDRHPRFPVPSHPRRPPRAPQLLHIIQIHQPSTRFWKNWEPEALGQFTRRESSPRPNAGKRCGV